MKTIQGDLIKIAKAGKFDLIIHGCNCFCVMGAGIAKTIKSEFPEAYKADQNTKKGDKEKLGNYSLAEVTLDSKKLIIINAYTQFDYGGNITNVSYDSIKEVFKKIKKRIYRKDNWLSCNWGRVSRWKLGKNI